MDALIEVFNRYIEKGGEELIADRILGLLGTQYSMRSLRWSSAEWQGANAPGYCGQVMRMFYNRDSAQSLREAIRAQRPKAIIAHNLYPVASPSIYLEAKRLGVPVLQFTHNFRPFSVNGTLWTGDTVATESLRGDFWREVRTGAWQDSVIKSAVLAAVLKWQRLHGSLDAVTRWIAISDFMRTKFIEAGLPEERVVTLRHFWEPMETRPQVEDDGYYLFLGRLVPEKGVRILLEAWKALSAKLGTGCPRLVIAGTGQLEGMVATAAEECEPIEFRGFVEGEVKRDLMARARAFLAPSIWWEPLGLVTYEAYDYGKPMLAAASGGLCETVEDGETGFLFQPNRPEALTEAVEQLEATSAERRREMGERGRVWLIRENSKQKWMEKFNGIVAKAST